MLEFQYMKKDKVKRKSKAVIEKLGDVPFKTISEQKEFRDKIRLQVLKQLETAKAIEELTKQPEYNFFREKFEKGMHCRYGKSQGDIVHVFMNDDGIQIELNENANSSDKNQTLLVGTMVKSLSESLIASYYRAYGYITNDGEGSEFENKFLTKDPARKKNN